MKRTGNSKIAVVGWGRGMGHKGHMYLADAVITQAQQMNADPYFFVSKTVGKDDPVFPEEKVRIYQKVFPQHATIFEPQGNLNQALQELATLGYQGVVLVVGADQKQAFQYLEKPNKEGVPVYQSMGLKKLKVISRQETNSQFKNEEGPRATPMREILLDPNATEEDKFKVWRRDMPDQLGDRDVLDIMNKAESRLLQSNQPKQAKVKQMSQKVAKLKEAIINFKTKQQSSEPKDSESLGYKHLFKQPDEQKPTDEKRFHGWSEYEKEMKPEEVEESLIMDRNALINAFYVSPEGKKHRVAEKIPYYLLDKLVGLLTKKYNITMNDIEVRPADKTQYRRSSLPDLAETELNKNNPQADLDAKRQALQQMEREPGHDKEAIRQRKLDLEREASSNNLNEFAPDEGGGARKFIPWPEFIEQVKQIVAKDFDCVENVVKTTIKARFVPHDPMEFGPTMLYSYYETRAGRNKGAISTRGAIQIGKYTGGGFTGQIKGKLLTTFSLLKGHPFERHFDLTFDNIYKIANIIMGNTQGALEFQPEQQVNEFAPSDDGDNGQEDMFFKYAKLWYNGNEQVQQRIIDILDKAGWEIGEIESEEGGAFIVQSGDEDGGSYMGWSQEELQGLNEFAPGNGDDGLPYAEYQVYQCNPEDQFDWIGGPLYQTDSMGMAHKYAYEQYLKHRPKAFMVWQERSQGSRGNYGVKGQSDEDYLEE